jgi:hypothetical protein
MRRREFLRVLGGAAAAPLAAQPLPLGAQPSERMRRIGVLMGFAESDREWQARLAALRTALQDLGWTEGRNVRIDYRWAVDERDRLRNHPAELVAPKSVP